MPVEVIAVGLVVAGLFVEITGFYPGGIVVPAYIALYLDQPLRILGTAIVGVVTWIIYQILSKQLILFGRRRFVIMILIGGALGLLSYRLLPRLWWGSIELRVIGWVIPGLLANAFERQGIWLTLVGMGIASITTYFVVKLLAFALA